MVARLFAVFALIAILTPGRADDVQRLADHIDTRLAEKWTTAKVEPAGLCDDATYLRRLHLDLTGTIPTVAQVREFLADTAKNKRTKGAERLLSGPGYVRHFSVVWRGLLLGEDRTDADLEKWLQRQFADNVSYDKMVRAIVTQSMEPPPRGEPSPRAFFRGRENKPDELAADVTRMFLGVRLECAQCHDHPFANWKREQFWNQVAFFKRDEKLSVEIPGTNKVVPASFLDGSKLPTQKQPPRELLADWLTKKDNPFFARAAVNRLWGHFFGIGIVDPVDDFNDATVNSHPELLDELTRAFVAKNFDIKFIIQAILRSRAYQLSSSGSGPATPSLFERRAVRLLTPEQLFDSLVQASGTLASDREKSAFLARFPRSELRVNAPIGIPQALALMNGRMTRQMTDPQRNGVLLAVAEAPFLDNAARIETLFVSTLSRPPKPAEAKLFTTHIDKAKSDSDKVTALSDVFWALLNSAEFIHNH